MNSSPPHLFTSWTFERSPRGTGHPARSEPTCLDALHAVQQWCSGHRGRRYRRTARSLLPAGTLNVVAMANADDIDAWTDLRCVCRTFGVAAVESAAVH